MLTTERDAYLIEIDELQAIIEKRDIAIDELEQELEQVLGEMLQRTLDLETVNAELQTRVDQRDRIIQEFVDWVDNGGKFQPMMELAKRAYKLIT